MTNFINLFIKGIFVGVANIIPGVSGGTIAVVLSIFDQLISSINNFFKNPKASIKFLLPLALGSILGISVFSKIIGILLVKFSFPTNMFFVGLVLGSVPLIYNQAKKEKFSPKYYLVSFISFIIVVMISLMSTKESLSSFDTSFSSIIKFIFYGAISSSAMVIPGISGSFVMVLLGIYNVIIISISEFLNILLNSFSIISSKGFIFTFKYIFTSQYFIALASIGIGIILGIFIISKIISILLSKAFSITYFAILGLIFGSIFSIFNDPSTYQSYTQGLHIFSVLASFITFISGFFISIKFGK